MQYDFSCVPHTYDCIERTLSPARLARFLPAANGDRHLALRLYLWNAHLCETFYSPLQTAEVAARNAIEIPIRKRFGDLWYENPKFENLLPAHMKEDLTATLKRMRKKRGAGMTVNHIIGNLSFGFWVNLMTKAYQNHLWANGVRHSFPASGPYEDREAIHLMLDNMRSFRNDVMHHYAIFEKGPHKQYQNIIKIIELICPETAWLTTQRAEVSQVINSRPLV